MCPLVQPSPQSLSHHFNPLVALLHLGPAQIFSQPQPSAASPSLPGSLIKRWVEGSRRRWPPAEACSLILKGRHVGHPPPPPPTPPTPSLHLCSFLRQPSLSGVPCVASLGPLSTFSLFASRFSLTLSSEDALCTATWHQARMLYT